MSFTIPSVIFCCKAVFRFTTRTASHSISGIKNSVIITIVFSCIAKFCFILIAILTIKMIFAVAEFFWVQINVCNS